MTIKRGEQLKLFMSPSELMGSNTHIFDIQEGESAPSFWQRKETEARKPYGTVTDDPDDDPGVMAHGAGVYDSVRKQGLTSHVTVDHEDIGGTERLAIMDGYHRTAAAAAIEREGGGPQFVPVLHGPLADWSQRIPESYRARHWPQNVRHGWGEE